MRPQAVAHSFVAFFFSKMARQSMAIRKRKQAAKAERAMSLDVVHMLGRFFWVCRCCTEGPSSLVYRGGLCAPADFKPSVSFRCRNFDFKSSNQIKPVTSNAVQ